MDTQDIIEDASTALNVVCISLVMSRSNNDILDDIFYIILIILITIKYFITTSSATI